MGSDTVSVNEKVFRRQLPLLLVHEDYNQYAMDFVDNFKYTMYFKLSLQSYY